MQPLKARKKLNMLTQASVFAALMCILSPLAIPVGPIPVTLGSFAVLLTGLVLPWRRAAAAVGIYLLMGLMGLPVFSGGGSGFGVLMGPTGGYLWCYLPMAVLVSVLSGHRKQLCAAGACLCGTLLCYGTGTLQFMALTGSGFRAALALCVWPFIPFDLVKMVCASLLGVRMVRQLHASGLLD